MGAFREWRHTIREIADHPLNQGGRLKALSSYLLWNVGRRLVRAEYVMPIGEARIILSNEENYSTLTYLNELWDFGEMAFLLHVLRSEDLFADIGANVGAYTILASAARDARSIAIEPVPETFRKLQANMRLNDIGERAELHNIGLAEEEGVLRFTAKRGGCNHVLASSSDAVGVEVQVSTLDTLLRGRVPLLIKIDVEGYEMPVLRGATACLSNPELHAIIVELNETGMRYGYSDEEVHRLLRGQGFEPFDYHPFRRALTPRTSFETARFNTLYVRPADDFVRHRLATAPKIRVRGREI